MPNINTVIDSAATTTQAADTVQNPTTVASVAAAAPGNHVVHIALQFRGITVDPAAIRSMVDTQFGTVASVKESVARGCYIFQIET